MAADSHVELFDKTVQESHGWLQDVMQETGLDRYYSLQALRGVLHALRDEITADQSGHLAAQMPTLIRGLYFEGWDPSRAPAVDHDREHFIDRVRVYFLGYDAELDYPRLIRSVLRVLERRMPAVMSKVKRTLPREIRSLFPGTVGEQTAERHAQLAAEERIATYEALHAEAGHERGAPMAPHQNRPPGEQHRGGPLPNRM
ncbi:MAG: DUF2267 domain-containing protein [Vulcanimicrobiaceae bacterium]